MFNQLEKRMWNQRSLIKPKIQLYFSQQEVPTPSSSSGNILETDFSEASQRKQISRNRNLVTLCTLTFNHNRRAALYNCFIFCLLVLLPTLQPYCEHTKKKIPVYFIQGDHSLQTHSLIRQSLTPFKMYSVALYKSHMNIRTWMYGIIFSFLFFFFRTGDLNRLHLIL